MNTAGDVTRLIEQWSKEGLEKGELVRRIAEACLGWPYVWGAAGQSCTPSYRRQYANRSSCPEDEAKLILSQCQVCKGKKSECDGCKWYPGGSTRIFDCRGFTRWVMGHADVNIDGGGATSQWNAASNWVTKGEIATLPKDIVCVLFWKSKTKPNTMGHTGLYLGNGEIIHCSGEVKQDTLATKGWTHWALPRGMDGKAPAWRRTIRNGCSGEDVTYAQEKLQKLGYDIGSTGADGKFGKKTEAAVKAFQKDNGLTADGVIGPMTWEALEKATAPNVTPVEKTYAVTIRGLDYTQAKALSANYPGSEIKEE